MQEITTLGIMTLALPDDQTRFTRHAINQLPVVSLKFRVAFQPISCLGNVVKKHNKLDFLSGNYGSTLKQAL